MGFVQFRAIKTNTQPMNQPDSEEFGSKNFIFQRKDPQFFKIFC